MPYEQASKTKGKWKEQPIFFYEAWPIYVCIYLVSESIYLQNMCTKPYLHYRNIQNSNTSLITTNERTISLYISYNGNYIVINPILCSNKIEIASPSIPSDNKLCFHRSIKFGDLNCNVLPSFGSYYFHLIRATIPTGCLMARSLLRQKLPLYNYRSLLN